MDAADRRIARELRTVRLMIDLYCRGNHGGDGVPCAACLELWEHARRKVGRCPFRADKPPCLDCAVHCFGEEMRGRIRAVMRYSGPRMAWRHPILSILHFLDGRRARRAPAGGRQRPAAGPKS